MSSDNCCLCASDEGILLDIFAGGGKAHCGKIETCLSVKIEKRNAASTKICHKCAYELDACSKFVQKYRDTRDVREGKSRRSKGQCALCLEPGVKGYIFELGEGTPLNNSLHKIRETFDDSFFKDQPKRLSICLNCRYNLDVLFDLKSVYQSTLDKLKDEKRTEASEYPRTKTSVVSRKTTYIPLPVLNGDKTYESDSSMSSAMPVKRKRGRPRKDSASSVAFRNCEQCDTAVEGGIDMYRYHRTGRTVCKDCWLKMDPEKVTNSKRRKLGLVLKDVLLNPSKYTSMYKVERDAKGNTTFLITDDSSENEEKDPPMKRGRRASSVDKKKSARRGASGKLSNREDETPEETIVQEMKKPTKRVVSGKWSNCDEEPPAKIAVRGRPKTVAERKEAFTSDSETMILRTRRNSIASLAKEAKAASLSDIETVMPVAKKMGRPRKIQTLKRVTPPKVMETRTQRLARRAGSVVETTVEKTVEKSVRRSVDKSVRKSVDKQIEKSVDKQIEKSVDKQIEKSVDKPAEKSVDKPAEKSVEKLVDESADNIDRPVKRSRANSETSQDLASSGRPTSSPRNAKSVSETGSSSPKTARSKGKPMSQTTSASETELEAPFACGVCKVEYGNKLIGMAHELTHSKQPEVKLQRVTIPEIIIEEAPTEPPIVEEPEQQSHDVSSTSDHSAVNADVDETPIVEAAPAETDTKPEGDEKSDERVETSVAAEETNVSVAESKDPEAGDDDSIEVIDKCENDEETKVTDIRDSETNDKNRKIEKPSANEEIDNDNCESERSNDDKVSEQRIENEETGKADSEEKSVEEETKENKQKHGEKAEKKDKEEEVKEADTAKVEVEDIEKVEEKDTEKVEEKDIEIVQVNNIENIGETDEEKKVEVNGKEESIKDSTEEPVKANGVDADHETDSEIDRTESVEVAESNPETNCGIANTGTPEVVHPESRETVENENTNESENKNRNQNEDEIEKSAKHEKITSVEEAENKSLESTLENAPVEIEKVDGDVAVRKESESVGVVTDVLREVFDLATAEVQKRLDTERPNDEKCSTPVAETVENISREIQNSADMPSLEPLVEDRSAKERS